MKSSMLLLTCEEDEMHMMRRAMVMIDGWRERGRPKKRWIDCVRLNMKEKVEDDEIGVDSVYSSSTDRTLITGDERLIFTDI
ncbi:unnamed protein product, partial [Brenthis ino]